VIAKTESEGAEALAELQREIDGYDDAELQRLLTVAVRAYSRRSLDRPAWEVEPFAPGAEVTATEAIVTAGAILRAAEISSFELASIFNF
jgi:hypothetical protein